MADIKKVFFLAEGGKAKASAALSWCPTNSSHNSEMPFLRDDGFILKGDIKGIGSFPVTHHDWMNLYFSQAYLMLEKNTSN